MIDIDELFTDRYIPKERRRLYMGAYFERGLIQCRGNRDETAEFLGFSVTGLRRALNKDHPELNKAYPNFYIGDPQITYEMQKYALLRATPNYWVGDKRKEIQKQLITLANSLGVVDKSLE